MTWWMVGPRLLVAGFGCIKANPFKPLSQNHLICQIVFSVISYIKLKYYNQIFFLSFFPYSTLYMFICSPKQTYFWKLFSFDKTKVSQKVRSQANFNFQDMKTQLCLDFKAMFDSWKVLRIKKIKIKIRENYFLN